MNDRQIVVLLIEDNPGDARLIRELLGEAGSAGLSVECARRLSDGLDRMAAGGVDVVLLDLGLPDSQGLNTFARAHGQAPHLPIVVLTGLDDEAVGVDALRMGAQDYLVKGTVDSHLLRRSLSYAVERKYIAEALAQKAHELARSNAELEELTFQASRLLLRSARRIAVSAHELETGNGSEPADRSVEDLHEILREAEWIRDFANAMVVFSEAAGEPQASEAIGLGNVAQLVLSNLDDLIRQTGARVKVEELPTVKADGEHMRLLVRNLVGNAVKFHKEGEAPVVHVTGAPPADLDLHEPEGQAWALSVQDQGIGFEEQHLDEMLTVFGRLHGLDEYEGTGVGLATCRKIVERQGGTIMARSRPGEGATFAVTLPAEHVRQPAGRT